ncbi:hypothetical protein QBC32DRAFT_215132 [Pseudoneurospora amorphoporcata]|uniref:Uncharacterized protein n=1 Tax=Pseudoneurospora amorphoporcata TaxID=241081 RepID=A0AAN6SFT0_9PEZI|nr:hypothetical protein QBC32DRAFT_215132 [Pseudoneurospora amorphoporcata]
MAPDSFVKDLDYEYTCRTKDDDAVPPPWDWTLNVCWFRFPQASKRGQGDDDVAAFQCMTAMNSRCTSTEHKPGHWGYFCLPANVALKICRYIVQNHSTDKPARLSTSCVYNGPYPVNQNGESEFFESVDQASGALSRYWQVSHSFKLDVQAAFFLTRRFHLVISPFGPTEDMGWLHSHGRFVKNITIEFDCTKFYGGKPMMRELDAATGCPELFDKKQLQEITAPDKDARRSVGYYKLTFKPVLEYLSSGRAFPIDRLTIMVRKYHGSRENMPRGYPYFDPIWLNFLLLIPRALQSNVLSLETIGVPPRLLGLMIHRFWREGKPPTEDAQRQHFRWGPFPPTLWPLMPGHTAAVSVPGSIDPTVDRLLRLDRPGEVAIFPLPEEESQESRDARAAWEMLTKWKAKKPPSQGKEILQTCALTETKVKSEQEPSTKAMEQQQQQQQQTQQPRRLSRLLKFMNPGKGEAGPSGSLTATKAMPKEAEPADNGRQSQLAEHSRRNFKEQELDEDGDAMSSSPKKRKALHMQRARDRPTELANVLDEVDEFPIPPGFFDPILPRPSSPIAPTGSTTANATTGTIAGPAAFENNDSGLGLWETEDTAFSAEQPWTKVEKKSRRRNGSKQLQISQTKTNKKSTARQVQTSLQNLKAEWTATVGEFSNKTKHDSNKAESIAGSSKKGETKKAGENKSVKSGSTATSASNSRESRSSTKDVRLPETRAPPSPPRTSELHIAGSQLDKPGKTKAEDKDAESGIALIVKETGSKDSVGTLPSSQSSLPTLHLSMEEVPKVRLPLPKNDEVEKPTRSPPQSEAKSKEQGKGLRTGSPKPLLEDKGVEGMQADDKAAPQPQPQLQVPSLQRKTKMFQSAKNVEKINKGLARTKAFPPQGQQQHFHPAGPFPSAPYPYSQLSFQSQTEASAFYNHYRKPKELALGMLPTMGGSRTMPQYSHAPIMSQAPPTSMPQPQDQWQPMYQAQVPVMHPWGPTAQMPPVFTMSQMPGAPQVRNLSQVPPSSQVQTMSKAPVMPLYQTQPMSQMQPLPQTQAFIHPQPNIPTDFYQVPPPTTMSQVPPNPPAHFPQPLWISQPRHQAPQSMYPVQQTYQAPPLTYYPPQPTYPEAQTGNIGQEQYSTQQGY